MVGFNRLAFVFSQRQVGNCQTIAWKGEKDGRKKTHKKSVQTRSSLLNKRKMTTATTAKRYQDFYFDVEHALKVTVMEIYWLLLRRDWTISKISLKLDCFIRNCVYDFVRMDKAVVNQKSRQLKFLFNSELRVWRGWAFTKCSNHKWNWRS